MLRSFLFILAIGLCVLTREGRAQIAGATVHVVRNADASTGWAENPVVTRRMTERLVTAVTGQTDQGRAWRTLVSPKDRVGIKVSAAGGRYGSTRRGVVEAVVLGLEAAGVPRQSITIWDRDSAALRTAGFSEVQGGTRVRAIDPPSGYDAEARVSAPVMGRLIWGDLLFRGRTSEKLKLLPRSGEQLTADSHLARVLSRDVTKVVNLAVLTDNRGAGIAGAIYNMVVPNVDNSRRFLDGMGASSMLDVYEDPRVGGKVVLHILDGLVAQYAGGPAFQPDYAFEHGALYGSRDPVALDATALRLMEGWRLNAKLPRLGRGPARWLAEAEALGIGVAAEERITISEVR